MKKLATLVFVLGTLAGTVTAVTAAPPASLELDEEQQRTWLRFWEEHRGHQLIMKFSEEYEPATLAIVGVNVVPMTERAVLPDQTVIVRDGRITEIGPSSEIPLPPGANRITPTGFYLAPGLVDCHTHTITTLHQFLLYLTRGVTTVREMDGWPWMLEARRMAAANELLIPNLFVAGHILSSDPFDFFMTRVDTTEVARRVVAQQAAAGYDFIKVHDAMPLPVFRGVVEAAHEHELDVAGHVPEQVGIAQAVASGMRTLEHLAGYFSQETSEVVVSDDSWLTPEAQVWLTPTFAVYHDHLRGEEAWRLAETESSLRLVPRWLRRFWERVARSPVNPRGEQLLTEYPKKRAIVAKLRDEVDRFLAGTDTGTYSYVVAGYALQEEVRIFEDLGLTPFEALATATVNPAAAMRKADEVGTIEVGKRADFVIVKENPLETTKNLADVWGVSLRGIWLGNDALEWIESSLEEAFSDANPVPDPSPETMKRLVLEIEGLHARGFPYPAYLLTEIAELLGDLGQQSLSARLERLARPLGAGKEP